jgi:hypothetical protein
MGQGTLFDEFANGGPIMAQNAAAPHPDADARAEERFTDFLEQNNIDDIKQAVMLAVYYVKTVEGQQPPSHARVIHLLTRVVEDVDHNDVIQAISELVQEQCLTQNPKGNRMDTARTSQAAAYMQNIKGI